MKTTRLQFLTFSLFFLAISTLFSQESEVRERMKYMDCLVTPKVEEAVVKRVMMHLRGKKDTEKMIGRSAIYFPIFDEMLKEYELPLDLKYITVLETELNNFDISHSGATGVWQLMADVKAEFGLRIDRTHDERYDYYRSSEAALKDFKRMYAAYNNWEMTLAGYNCGVGRLAGAIKRARSRNWEDVKAFLPAQTQQYIGKFVAYSYLMKNYQHHGLKPKLPNLDQQLLGRTKVYNYISLDAVANIVGLPTATVRELNRQYGEGYIPENSKGNNIVLPRRVLPALIEYLASPDNSPQTNFNFTATTINDVPGLEDDPNYFATTYSVGDGETLENLSNVFNCSPYNIMLWNNLDSYNVPVGQELTFYLPKVVPKRV